MKRIYLIRHGQTDYNLNGIIQGGSVDTDLNNTGKKQADDFYHTYKTIPFDKVYTSVLKRSIQSVQKFIESGIPHEAYKELNEISWGEKDGKIATTEDSQFYLSMIKAWSAGEVDQKVEGGESPQEVKLKQQKIIDLILSRKEESNVLICMHGRAIRILLTTLLNYPLKCMDQFEHHNLGLYILTYTGTMFTVDLYNSTQHLTE